MRPRLADGVALLLALGAVAASAWVADRIFERLPHVEDEFANLWEAEVMAHGRITLPSPPQPDSFLVPFVVDYHGQRFGKYPPGWPATLALGARLGAAWLVNPLLAGLGVWLVYRLGSKLAGQGVGLLAGLLTAGSPMFLMLSGSLMSHSLGLVLTLAFALAWFDLFPSGEARPRPPAPAWMLVGVAGLALGLMALTRPLTAVGVALPFAAHGLVLVLRGGREARRRLTAVAGLAAVTAAILPLWQWALTGDPRLNPYILWWSYDKVGFGLGYGRMASGHNLHWAYINTRNSLRVGLHDLFGWPYLSWLFLPFGLIALRRSRGAWLSFSLFPSLVLVYAAYWVGAWLLGPRYYYESLGGLAVLSAAGVAWLAGWLKANAQPVLRLRPLGVSGLVIVLLALNVGYYLPPRLRMMHGLYGITRQAMQPLQEARLGRALVIVHPAQSWTDYGTLLTLTPPFADSALLLAYSRGAAQDARLTLSFADRPVFHYYADSPDVFYAQPR